LRACFDLEGSGFILGNRYIATAYHVVEDLDEIELKFNNGKKILTKKDDCLVAYSKERDIALLKLDFDGYSPVCIEENLSANDPVYFNRPVSGSNFQQGSKVEGVLNSIESMAFYSLINKDKNAPGPGIIGTNLYLATLQALRGDSGSAVLDKNGCVVGVASSIHSHALGATCIVQAKYLKKLLEFYSKKAE
jgi:S1-C subfamily serine protease